MNSHGKGDSLSHNNASRSPQPSPDPDCDDPSSKRQPTK